MSTAAPKLPSATRRTEPKVVLPNVFVPLWRKYGPGIEAGAAAVLEAEAATAAIFTPTP